MSSGLRKEALIEVIKEGFRVGLKTELSQLQTHAAMVAGLLPAAQLKILCEISVANHPELYTSEDFWVLVEMGLLSETEGRVRVTFPGSLVATHHFRKQVNGNQSPVPE